MNVVVVVIIVMHLWLQFFSEQKKMTPILFCADTNINLANSLLTNCVSLLCEFGFFQ